MEFNLKRIMPTSCQRAFTLIELLVVIVIIITISTLVFLLINPAEEAKRSRDAIRLSDASAVFRAINIAIDVAGEPSGALLCVNIPTPCSGSSLQNGADSSKSDGSGWVKVKLDTVAGAVFPTLPIDPINKEQLFYEYRSDGANYEITVLFESKDFSKKMLEDGGNQDGKYELGSVLTLIN